MPTHRKRACHEARAAVIAPPCRYFLGSLFSRQYRRFTSSPGDGHDAPILVSGDSYVSNIAEVGDYHRIIASISACRTDDVGTSIAGKSFVGASFRAHSVRQLVFVKCNNELHIYVIDMSMIFILIRRCYLRRVFDILLMQMDARVSFTCFLLKFRPR